jgi:hypothetical protein
MAEKAAWEVAKAQDRCGLEGFEGGRTGAWGGVGPRRPPSPSAAHPIEPPDPNPPHPTPRTPPHPTPARWSLVVINPGLVMGPPIAPTEGESIHLMRRVMRGDMIIGWVWGGGGVGWWGGGGVGLGGGVGWGGVKGPGSALLGKD